MHVQEHMAGDSQKGKGVSLLAFYLHRQGSTVGDLHRDKALRNVFITNFESYYLLHASGCGFPHS